MGGWVLNPTRATQWAGRLSTGGKWGGALTPQLSPPIGPGLPPVALTLTHPGDASVCAGLVPAGVSFCYQTSRERLPHTGCCQVTSSQSCWLSPWLEWEVDWGNASRTRILSRACTRCNNGDDLGCEKLKQFSCSFSITKEDTGQVRVTQGGNCTSGAVVISHWKWLFFIPTQRNWNSVI